VAKNWQGSWGQVPEGGTRMAEISIPAGTRGIDISGTMSEGGTKGMYSEEQEVLLDRGLKFRVTGYDPANLGSLKMEVVP
jgi:hypothetical protein